LCGFAEWGMSVAPKEFMSMMKSVSNVHLKLT